MTLKPQILACLAALTFGAAPTPAATTAIDPDMIVFGYPQDLDVLPYVRWHALTHMGTTFIDFDANGDLMNLSSGFTNRDATLKTGGAAQNAGTKVVMVVRNDEFYDGTPSGEPDVINVVMQSQTRRENLADQIIAAVEGDSYCAGVSLDFEFTWGTTTRDGITAFMQYLRANLDPSKEISIYTHATYNANLWDIAATEPYFDYMLYSTYDWGTGNNTHTASDYDSILPQIQKYFVAGLPSNKMVLVWGSYGRRWTGVTGYNSTGSSPSSRGWADGYFATTLDPRYSGPQTANYVTGDETAWHTYNDGTNNYTMVWDSPASFERKLLAALSLPDSTGTNLNGRRLRGVGFWSLMWMGVNGFPDTNQFKSYDARAGAVVTRMRTYPHVYQLCTELFAEPGTTRFPFERFESSDNHWRDPNESPDSAGDTDSDSASSYTAAPAGAGRPASTTNGMRVLFDFESAGANKLFFRHEILNDNNTTSVTDTNAAICLVERNTAFSASYYTAASYASRTLRMAVVDGDREVEVSPPVTLNTTGWQTMTWDLTDPASIVAYDTSETNVLDGDGVIDSTAGARDIKFLGFLIEGTGSGSGEIILDELAYEHRSPAALDITINEFNYASSSYEFVEIEGPAGTLPTGTQIRFYNSTNGSVSSTVDLGGQVIPASGLFVIGDPGVANTTGGSGMVPSGWTAAANNIPDTAPGALQVYNTVSGNVSDSVTYRAMGTLGGLARQESRNVVREGYPWLGATGSGGNSAGVPGSYGRYPDGTDTQINGNDLSLMPPTPGASNGGSLTVGASFDFSTVPASAFSTKDLFSVTTVAGGMAASPSGGNVHRCYGLSDGNVSYFGDAALGDGGAGYTVEGELYIPATTHPGQAIGIGFCGRQGSTFFTGDPSSSGYDSGYWLIYEHGSVDLSDGQNSHAGQFQFLHATNDNMDPTTSTALGSLKGLNDFSPAIAPGTTGTWVTFRLTVDPSESRGFGLLAQINDQDVYRGVIPTDGPTAGAIQVGHREFDGSSDAVEGTWVDNIRVTTPVPVSLSRFSVD